MYYNELFMFTTTNLPGHSSARPMAHTMTAAMAQASAAALATAAYGAAAVLSVQQLRLLAQLQQLPLVPGDQLAAV